MERPPEQFKYTEEAALEEAEKIKEKVSSGEAKSYEEADWLADKERFAVLNTLEVEIGGDFQKVLEAINAASRRVFLAKAMAKRPREVGL